MSPTRGWNSAIARWPAPFATGAATQAIDLIEALPLGVALLDHVGTCYQTNAVFTETVGLDCTGYGRILEMAIPSDRAALARAIVEALSRVAHDVECRLRLAIRPEETVVVTIVRGPPGWGLGALLAVRDIREQMRLEKQVAQATKMQAVGQLAGGIAHDFNNILTAILGLCDQLLTRHMPGDPAVHAPAAPAARAVAREEVAADDLYDIDQIRLNGVRAANLVRQLLAFARQQTLRPEVLDVADVIAGLVPLIERLLGPDVALVIAAPPGIGITRADPGQLEQVLVNLAVNARDAMDGRGQLTIASHAVAAGDVAALGHAIMPAADFVAITVTDTGSGIDPAIAAKIFEPFFTTKPIGQGTGLGLSTVYGIVKQTGGFVFAAPADGGGTCFAVYLPAAERIEVEAPLPLAAPLALTGTVLLVEDDRAVRLVVERALRRHGLTVIAATDGAAALDALAVGVDILVSDVVMPGIDGVELVDRVRAHRPGLPVVLMSGYAEPPQRRALDGAGVIFIAKPFAVAELLGAVRDALAAAA